MRPPRRLGPFVLASAALHVLALLLVSQIDWRLPSPERPLMVRVVPAPPPSRVPPPATTRPAPGAPAQGEIATLPPTTPPRAPEAAPPARPAPTPPAQARPTPPPPPADARGQIVDLPNRPRPGERMERPPADTRYLSERDRVVERETRARQRPGQPGTPGEPGEPQAPAAGGPTPPPAGGAPGTATAQARPAAPASPAAPPQPPQSQAPQPPAPAVAQRPTPAPAQPATPSPTGTQPAREPAPRPADTQIARLEPPRPATPPRPESPRAEPAAPQPPRPDAPEAQPRDARLPSSPAAPGRAGRAVPNPEREGAGDGSTPPERPLPGLDKLLPAPGQLARLSPSDLRRGAGRGGQGGTGPRDYLPGIEEGDETFLNSREFRYAYYFNHVKSAIGAQWNPGAALERAFGPSGGVVPAEAFTELILVVEKDGRVTGADLSRPSGVEPLDREAVRAVRAAGQFPAPPAGLLGPDGKLRFQFGFVVTTGGGRLTFYGPDDRDLRNRFFDPFGQGRLPKRP